LEKGGKRENDSLIEHLRREGKGRVAKEGENRETSFFKEGKTGKKNKKK